MPGFDHTPHVSQQPEPAANPRLGLIFFFVYLALYAAFVLINAFQPEMMDALVPGGVNLAVAYGFALIAAAFVLALAYGWMRRQK